MAKMLKILMIEDHPGDARLTQAKLAQANGQDVPMFEVEWVNSLTEGLTRLEDGAGFDVVLTDLDLPDSPREETLSRLRTHAPQLPIVVLGGWDDEALALQCVREGAQDYLFKGHVTDVWLAQALRYAVARQRAQAQIAPPLVARKTEALNTADRETRILIGNMPEVDGGHESPIVPDPVPRSLDARPSCRYRSAGGCCRAEEFQHFMRGVSHDLRTPLRIVKRYAERLGDVCGGQRDAEVQQCVHFVVEGATHMEQMLEGLLAYVRAEGDEETLVRTDIEDVLARVLQTLQDEIVACDAEVTHDPLPTLLVDAVQLERVFQNLISNGLKYQPRASDKGAHKPRLHIAAQAQGDTWRFAVQDNGIGIAPEHHERIFDVFDRLHTPEEYEGTGIGLAICKRIIARYNGRIWVESEVGQGATFYFTLPRLQRE